LSQAGHPPQENSSRHGAKVAGGVPGSFFAGSFSYGGQAVIEGVMMRGPRSWAVAVRQPDGSIAVEKEETPAYTERCWFFRLPLVRGSIVLFDSLVLGLRALSKSANLAMDSEEEELSWREIAGSVLLAFFLAVLLFIVVPTGAAHLARYWIPGVLLQNVFEGIIRMAVFVAYLLVISRMKDIERVFMYHGAEHKVINAYESGEALTPENVGKYPTLHPRCGTSFLLVVLVISIFVFALLGGGSLWWKIGSRILVLPVVAGLGYEFVRASSRWRDKAWANFLVAPGLWFQKLTTREPDDGQLGVAIRALQEVLQD